MMLNRVRTNELFLADSTGVEYMESTLATHLVLLKDDYSSQEEVTELTLDFRLLDWRRSLVFFIVM